MSLAQLRPSLFSYFIDQPHEMLGKTSFFAPKWIFICSERILYSLWCIISICSKLFFMVKFWHLFTMARFFYTMSYVKNDEKYSKALETELFSERPLKCKIPFLFPFNNFVFYCISWMPRHFQPFYNHSSSVCMK